MFRGGLKTSTLRLRLMGSRHPRPVGPGSQIWAVWAVDGGHMSTKTLTRADLTEAVFAAVGLARNEASQLVEDILEEVCGALSRGETVKLSSFGTFQVRQKSQRVGRNPKTGDEVPIAPRRVLVFRPSHVLKAQINHSEEIVLGEA